MKIPSCLTAHRRHTVFTLTLAALLASQAAQAETFIWSGTTSTDFETGTNWVGDTAPDPATLSDVAVFTGTPTVNQPLLSMDRGIGALVFGTATGGWSLGGGSALVLGDLLTVGATTGVGIDASAMTSGTATISTNNVYLASGSPQTWLIGTGGTLVVNSRVQPYTGALQLSRSVAEAALVP